MIKLGDKVTWFSGANGTYIEKEGVVVEVVKPGKLPDPARYPAFILAVKARPQESFIVAVKTAKSQKYYWPRVSALRVIGGES